MKYFLFIMVYFCCSWTASNAQLFPPKNYPTDYFIWPLDAPADIVANFGELRPNHFHMGLDCRTAQGENRRVLSAADGFISRINIDAIGFGRAIYIEHPNGLTTVYAHLNDFFPELQAYTKAQQYEKQQWKISIIVPKEKFPVKKGDFIAYSGNTGGSMGPHLHFEIRDTKSEKVLNQLFFGLPLTDKTPPDITKLALYDRNKSTYEQSPLQFAVSKSNGRYQPGGSLIKINTDKISFGISATDRINGSSNPNGIYGAMVYLDKKIISGFEIDSVSYDETRYLNAHIDYKTKATGGSFIQHLAPLPGYTKGIYKCADGEDGILRIQDTLLHHVRIEVYDVQHNTSVIEFDIKKTGTTQKATQPSMGPVFTPGQVNVFENESVWLYLSERMIYDFFHLPFAKKTGSEKTLYHVGGSQIPVHDYFPIRIRDSFSAVDTGNMLIKLQSGDKTRYKKAVYKNGWYEASFRELGDFELLVDHVPPVIQALWGFKDGVNASRMSNIGISATDNNKDLASFTAWLDGKWLMFSNDKEKSFIYSFDEHCPPGEHLLEIVVKDVAGNETKARYRFTR